MYTHIQSLKQSGIDGAIGVLNSVIAKIKSGENIFYSDPVARKEDLDDYGFALACLEAGQPERMRESVWLNPTRTINDWAVQYRG